MDFAEGDENEGNEYFTKERTSDLTAIKQENNGFPDCFPAFPEVM